MVDKQGTADKRYSRVVTHTDFDGVVSALLVRELFDVDEVVFAEPWMLQKKEFNVRRGDVIVDLPYGEGCALWFDHHSTSLVDAAKGIVDAQAKSCARVIFEHYRKEHPALERFRPLVDAADKIDSASFTREDLERPDVYGKISMSIRGDEKRKDDEFRLFLLNMLAFQTAEQAIAQPIIRKRVEEKVRQHEEWLKRIAAYVKLEGKVIFVDRTSAPDDLPRGQPFWLYLMYPGHSVYLLVDNLKWEPDKVKFSCGENIFEQLNAVDIGALMQRYGGGGHKVAGGCSVLRENKDDVVRQLLETLNE
jgi:oligoribonuclease NrnB/cAMP/cGMP phosphodiesterase (DHH superfamily)